MKIELTASEANLVVALAEDALKRAEGEELRDCAKQIEIKLHLIINAVNAVLQEES